MFVICPVVMYANTNKKTFDSQPDFIDDIYWSGSAPLCFGGCEARHEELRRDRCGDSSCCWLGHKSLCRGKTPTMFDIVLTLDKSLFV